MAFPFGAALGAGADLIGSGLSFLGASNANAANAAASANATNTQYNLAKWQIENNNWLAENGISIRVNDAKNAGISPLVALGAPTFSPGPVQMVGDAGGPQTNAFAGSASGLSGMGQDISRAAMAAQTEAARTDTLLKVEAMRNNSTVANSEAERNFADAALARKKAEMLTGMPSMPSPSGSRFVDGQGNSPDLTVTKPSVTISGAGGVPGVEAATTPAVKPVVMTGGGIDPQPSLGSSVGATGETLGYTIRNRMNPPSGYHIGWDFGWYPDKGSTWWDRPFGYSRQSPQRSWPFN